MSANIKTFSSKVIEEIKNELGSSYELLSEEEKKVIIATAESLMLLSIQYDEETDPNKRSLIHDKLIALRSTVADWKVSGQIELCEAFWRGVYRVACTLGRFLGNFAIGAIIAIKEFKNE